MCHVVGTMAIETKIDKQGRLIIPAEFRKKMNLNDESPIEIILVADQIILRKKEAVNEKKIEKWKKELQELNLKVNTEENEEPSKKWLSEKYVRNKLGF